MSQMTWTYIDDTGYRHRIGLFHGDDNHHLMLYCDARVILIDFGVTASKNYAFYINDELMDVRIEEKNGKFAYGLAIDEVTDTPRNRRRWKARRTDFTQAALAGVVLVAIIAAILIWVLDFNG